DRTGIIYLYRVVMMPHFVRARHRRRCRNFVDKSIKDILKVILENQSPAYPSGNAGLQLLSGDPQPPATEPDWSSFQAPTAQYPFALTDESPVTDATTSPYIVQYNETDFDFFARLCEREGISYYFEQTDDATVLTLSDAPGQDPLSSTDETFELRGASRGGNA